MIRFYCYLLLVSGAILFISCKKKETLFKRLSVEQTGINFSNRITENDTLNALEFEYVYNGGGVALGDFNNDKLIDVYFTGNQVSNRLYLNKGNQNGSIKFEDITNKSRATGENRWCSGVTLIDINNDSLLDIYVCATVKETKKDLANMLYVNQGIGSDGIPVFKEMAKEYGIDDVSHTTNAAFFDYDNDGDLDLFLLVNEMEEVRFPNKYVPKITDGSSKRTDRLYRNDSPKLHFTNVSKEAGILIEGYGLGLNITDINRDGWKDIYVTNDYLSDDLLYINNKDGTFKDQSHEYFKHTSFSGMGNDVEDINNDGLVDILALDMLPEDNYRKKMMLNANNYFSYINNDKFDYSHQYIRNTLQVNQGFNNQTGKPVFSEMGLLAGISETDWSWCPMITDFNNDGYRDIIITNGFPKDVTDHDYLAFRYNAAKQKKATLSTLLNLMPSVKISNYAFKNNGNLQFENATTGWGMDTPSFSNGAAYGDLDNDGDMDYIVNNINDSAFVYLNNSIQLHPDESHYLRVKFKGLNKNINGIGAWAEIKYNNGQKQVYENTPYRGYLSTIENVAHFGLGKCTLIDEMKIIWQSGKIKTYKNIHSDQLITVDESEAKDVLNNSFISNKTLFNDVTDSLRCTFVHQENDFIDFNIQKLLPHKLSQYGSAIGVGDVNKDGLEDIFIGGSTQHKGSFLIQNSKGKFIKSDLIRNETDAEKMTEDAGILFFDADQDNDMDLYIVSGSVEQPLGSAAYQDRLYINDGKGNFLQNKKALPSFIKSGSCVKAIDYDHDGDLDLFIGGRVEPNSYPKPVNSFIIRNDNNGTKNIHFTDVTAQFAPDLQNVGLICDALWTDFDNDGWEDLMLAGEWMPLLILKNKEGKSLKKVENTGLENKTGFWNSLVSGDFDDDGDMDYIAGNLGTNTLNKISSEYPTTIYGKDFNADGFYDAVPTVFFPDRNGTRKEVTFHGRDDLIKQMNVLRQLYTNYASFANADIHSTFTQQDLSGSLILKANYSKTSFIQNMGNGKFNMHELPYQAQTAPVFGMLVEDFDTDGNLDVLMVGNDYGNEVSVGRLDAFNGLLLKGNGKGKFKPALVSESGFLVGGDAKDMVRITNKNGNSLIMVTQNKGKLKVFNYKKFLKIKVLNENETTMVAQLNNGKTRKIEIGFGTSFFSQSSRSVLMHPYFKSIKLNSR